MAVGFFGRYEHALDSKGRLILPSKFRTQFEHGGYLSQYLEGCLALFTPADFEAQMSLMQSSATNDPKSRNLARVWAAGTQDVTVDSQGRLSIPTFQREFAGLTSDVLINGAIDRIEIWNPTIWSSKTAMATAVLLDGESGQ